MESKAMGAGKRNGGQAPCKIARKDCQSMKASAPKQRGKFAIEQKSLGKIPNK